MIAVRLAAMAAFALAVMCGVPRPAAAMETPQIQVSGQASVSAPPDRASLSAGVVTQAETAAAALDANNDAMSQVFAQLRALGIPEERIQTSNFSVSPQYAPYRPEQPQEPQRIVGYQVSNQVTVIVDDLDGLGEALDGLVRSGANQLHGVSFSIADPKPLEAQARREAVADAIAKARELAAAAGVGLGPILSIQEGGVARPLPMMRAEVFALDAVQIAPGELELSVSVSLSFAIQQ